MAAMTRPQSLLAWLFFGVTAIGSFCSAETAADTAALPETIVVCATRAIPHVYAKALDNTPGRTQSEVEITEKVSTNVSTDVSDWYEHSRVSSQTFDQFVDNFTGFDVELLKAFAATALKNATISVRLMETYPENLYSVREESCDIAVGGLIESFDRQNGCDCPVVEEGALPLEENVCCLTFLEYYHRDGVAVMIPAERSPSVITQVWVNLTTEEMALLFSCVALILFVLGHLIWFVETRRKGPESDFAESYSQGISDGLWWGAVTMTTVGYGDFVPRSLCGRVIGFFWMLAGVAVSGILIGLITDAFSGNEAFILANINNAEQLEGMRLCTVPGFFEEYAAGIDLTHKVVLKDTIEECWKDMLDEAANLQGKAEAVLHDHIGIVSKIADVQKHAKDISDFPLIPVEVSGVLQSTYVSIAVKQGNPLGPLLNSQLESLLNPRHVVFADGGDFSAGLYGWKIADAKDNYFPSSNPQGFSPEVFHLDPKPDGAYSKSAIAIICITFLLYAALMLYLILNAFLSRNKVKADGSSRDGKLPVAAVETDDGNLRQVCVNGNADLESLQATVADMAKAMSEYASQISELKQILSDTKKTVKRTASARFVIQ